MLGTFRGCGTLDCRHKSKPFVEERRCVQSRRSRRHAGARAQFVGERGTNATQYHDNDFDWNICIKEGEDAVLRQRREYQDTWLQGSSRKQPGVGAEYSDEWESFHHAHATGRFFKEKRYLTMAFPRLKEAYVSEHCGKPLHTIGEIGCGCGSALIPVLRDNPHAIAVACDVSSTAIDVFESVCSSAGIERDRIRLFVHSSGSPSQSPFEASSLDTMMIIFTLSAFHPDEMQRVLKEAWVSLKGDGVVLFRDYGLYDMAQLRFHGSQLVDESNLVYRRADGTLSNFFSVEFLKEQFSLAGFKTIECRYVTTYVRNKKKQITLKRVYVHGVFQKVQSA